jgi:hypothetical protein
VTAPDSLTFRRADAADAGAPAALVRRNHGYVHCRFPRAVSLVVVEPSVHRSGIGSGIGRCRFGN